MSNMEQISIEVFVLMVADINDEIKLGSVVMNLQTDNGQLRGELKLNEPLAKHTSWRVGGPADRLYVPADLDDLCVFISHQDEDEVYVWLGLGSNLLVRDGGIRGTVIAVAGILNELEICDSHRVRVGAGVTCNKFARFAANAELTGIEFLAGIPGTVGGALAMNAGAFGGETWDRVAVAETVNRHGELRSRSRDEYQIGYRHVSLPENEWFVAAEFQLEPDKNGAAHKKIREFLGRRSATQPTGESSCGSVFRNPVGDYAARLIDICGLKGVQIGTARVSGKHANFIVNDGGASAADIEELIMYVQKQVKEKTGIDLDLEVRIIGERL